MSDKQPASESARNLLDRVVEFVPFQQRESIRLSVGIVQTLLCKPTKSGKVCSEDQALRFIMLCKSRGLNPFEGDAFIVGYDGKDGPEFNLITSHQAFMKRAEAHASFDGMQSGVIVKNDGEIIDRPGDFFLDGDILLGAWAFVYRKDWKHPSAARVKLGSFNRQQSRWQTDPAGMIVKVAEADALRRAFPNQLGPIQDSAIGSFIPAAGDRPAQPPRLAERQPDPARPWQNVAADRQAEKEAVEILAGNGVVGEVE